MSKETDKPFIMQKIRKMLVGVNIAQSSNITIHLKDKKPDDIRFYIKPSGVTYPLEKAPPEQLILRDFKWKDRIKTEIKRRYI